MVDGVSAQTLLAVDNADILECHILIDGIRDIIHHPFQIFHVIGVPLVSVSLLVTTKSLVQISLPAGVLGMKNFSPSMADTCPE